MLFLRQEVKSHLQRLTEMLQEAICCKKDIRVENKWLQYSTTLEFPTTVVSSESP